MRLLWRVCFVLLLAFSLWAPVRAQTSPIAHVVIVLQENRTFDNLFHGYPGANSAMVGYDHDGHRVVPFPIHLMVPYDPPHQYRSWLTEYNGGAMNGFDLLEAHRAPAPKNSAYAYAMQSDVQPYWDLAKEGVLADEFFADHRSQSFAGHLFPIAGASGPIAADLPNYYVSGNPEDDAYCGHPGTGQAINILTGAEDRRYTSCFNFQTIGDLLSAKSLSWKYYVDAASKTSIVNGYASIEHDYRGEAWSHITTPETTVLSDIQNGTLPAVSWVIGTYADSDHAGQTVPSANGPTWVTSIFNAIGKSRYWRSSAVVLTYDDWGGWYDHVRPPAQFNAFEPGFRLPCVIVSPYAKRGFVSHKVHYMGSILHYIEKNFGLPSLGTSDARSDALDDVFDYRQSPLPYIAVTSPLPVARLFDADLPFYGNQPRDPEERD